MNLSEWPFCLRDTLYNRPSYKASPLKVVVKSNTDLLPVASAASSPGGWSKGQLRLLSGRSHCARRPACCLCAEEVVMKAAAKGRNGKSHVSPDASRQPWAPASPLITKNIQKAGRKDRLSFRSWDSCTLVLLCVSDFFSQRDDAETTELFSHRTKKQHT